LLQLFPRAEFQKAVMDTRAERHARGFTCWDQFVAMLFAQLGRAHSLREICGGLASCEGKLVHLGAATPCRSTLAYANAHRPWALYQTVFYQVLARCRTVAGAKPFRFKNKLLSLDATVIDLCAEMFPWAVFRRAKGAVKLHFTLDHDGSLPIFLVITDGKHHEGPMAREQTFAAGTILVFDKGYTDAAEISWPLAAGGLSHARRRPAHVPDQSLGARRVHRGADLPGPVADRTVFQSFEAEPAREDVCRDFRQCLAYSNLDGAHRPARAEVPATESALRLVAVEPGALLRMNLLVYRDLWAWLDDPFTSPPPLAGPVQGALTFN
jgi:hypothetical protein